MNVRNCWLLIVGIILVTICASCSSGPSEEEVRNAIVKWKSGRVDSLVILQIGELNEQFGRQCKVKVYMEYRYKAILGNLVPTKGEYTYTLVDDGFGGWEVVN